MDVPVSTPAVLPLRWRQAALVLERLVLPLEVVHGRANVQVRSALRIKALDGRLREEGVAVCCA